MKFNLNQTDLQKSLNYCQGVIEKRSTLPILSNILLDANNSKLTITATDLDLIFIHEIDNIEIKLENIIAPKTNNHLIIEGAGGLLVPLNDKDTILDLIRPEYKVVVVSRHYLGSINHTLLTVEVLKNRGVVIKGIVFVGQENRDTEEIILSTTGLKMIARIPEVNVITKEFIKEQANLFSLD